MTVGFIGLGTMGRGMASNLARALDELVVYDANPAAVQPLVELGATAASSIAELASQVQVLFTSLPGPAQVEEVLLGDGGVLQNMKPGLVVFELSTSSVSLARRLYDQFAGVGGSVLDAPISGGPVGAASGQLALWIGGDRDVYERHRDLLQIIGTDPAYVGSIGHGTVTKLAHNMLGYLFLESMAEVFSVAVKAGMDPLSLWKAMRLGLVCKRPPLDMLVNQFLPSRYDPPAFALRLAHKDVTLATGLAKELGVPMRLANLTLEEMTEALGRGMGNSDSRAYLQLQLERAGVEIAVDPEELASAVAEAASR